MAECTYLLSICITSYNRVRELQRCLNSLDATQCGLVEIIVSEDASPQRTEIQHLVLQYAETSPYRVVFNTNEQNLGYDCNLKKLIMLASGEYIMFLSDDDCLFPGKLDEFVACIQEQKPAMVYGSFWYGYNEKKRIRRKYPTSHIISKGEEIVSRRVYDAILFSGLTFRRSYLTDIDAERFKNTNYFQVYLFLSVIYQFGGYYLDTLLIDSVSDGENAYGRVASSDNDNNLLADRESVFSNLEFNRGLFRVIQMFDEDFGTNVFRRFCSEYSLRSIGGLCRARNHGMNTYKEYWCQLKNSGVRLSPVAYFYFGIVGLLGSRISKALFAIPKSILLSVRKHN